MKLCPTFQCIMTWESPWEWRCVCVRASVNAWYVCTMLRSLFRKDWACGVHILCNEQLNLRRNLSPWKPMRKNDAWAENSCRALKKKNGWRCNSEQRARCLLFCFAHSGFSWRSQTNTWMMTWMFLTLNFRITAAYFLKQWNAVWAHMNRDTLEFLFWSPLWFFFLVAIGEFCTLTIEWINCCLFTKQPSVLHLFLHKATRARIFILF